MILFLNLPFALSYSFSYHYSIFRQTAFFIQILLDFSPIWFYPVQVHWGAGKLSFTAFLKYPQDCFQYG